MWILKIAILENILIPITGALLCISKSDEGVGMRKSPYHFFSFAILFTLRTSNFLKNKQLFSFFNFKSVPNFN